MTSIDNPAGNLLRPVRNNHPDRDLGVLRSGREAHTRQGNPSQHSRLLWDRSATRRHEGAEQGDGTARPMPPHSLHFDLTRTLNRFILPEVWPPWPERTPFGQKLSSLAQSTSMCAGMALSPDQRAFNLSHSSAEVPNQIRLQRAKDRARALGLTMKSVKRSQLFVIIARRRATVPVAYQPMTLDEAEVELAHLARQTNDGC
jgi:hypothetical protein